MRNNKRRFEKILAAGLALGSFQGNLAGAALKKPVSRSSSNKSVVDRILSNEIAKGAILATGVVVGVKTFVDIGNGIYNKFKNKDVKSTEPGFVDFENAKISDLRGSNIVVYDGKILMSCDINENKDLDFKGDEFKKEFVFVRLGMHDGTKNQFLSAEDEISEWQIEKGDKREVKVFEYENDANFKKGMKKRKIHYLLDSKDGVAADDNNKIGLSTDTVFRIDGENFRFKINVPGIANLETKVFAKKMVSQHLGQGLELKEENIEIIPDDSNESNNEEKIKEYKAKVIEHFAKPKHKDKQRSIVFLSIPNENLVIVSESEEIEMKKEEKGEIVEMGKKE